MAKFLLAALLSHLFGNNSQLNFLNVRLGSKADLRPRVLRTSAYGGKADIKNSQFCSLLRSALCQQRTFTYSYSHGLLVITLVYSRRRRKIQYTMKPVNITNEIVIAYLNCRYKAQFLIKGMSGIQHVYARMMEELQTEYRTK